MSDVHNDSPNFSDEGEDTRPESSESDGVLELGRFVTTGEKADASTDNPVPSAISDLAGQPFIEDRARTFMAELFPALDTSRMSTDEISGVLSIFPQYAWEAGNVAVDIEPALYETYKWLNGAKISKKTRLMFTSELIGIVNPGEATTLSVSEEEIRDEGSETPQDLGRVGLVGVNPELAEKNDGTPHPEADAEGHEEESGPIKIMFDDVELDVEALNFINRHQVFIINFLSKFKGTEFTHNDVAAAGFYDYARTKPSSNPFQKAIAIVIENLNKAVDDMAIQRVGERKATKYVVLPSLSITGVMEVPTKDTASRKPRRKPTKKEADTPPVDAEEPPTQDEVNDASLSKDDVTDFENTDRDQIIGPDPIIGEDQTDIIAALATSNKTILKGKKIRITSIHIDQSLSRLPTDELLSLDEALANLTPRDPSEVKDRAEVSATIYTIQSRQALQQYATKAVSLLRYGIFAPRFERSISGINRAGANISIGQIVPHVPVAQGLSTESTAQILGTTPADVLIVELMMIQEIETEFPVFKGLTSELKAQLRQHLKSSDQ